MQVVDAIEADGLLRFWGISYGTVLGVTLAALFPSRMERMILVGLINPIEYYRNRLVDRRMLWTMKVLSED
jgi:pimeloyl-ACP methyl ester carboxylesterase